MGFYIRKSMSRGPVRLNISKSGIGFSFGIKGLRIGPGPKGTYFHAGRHGLYYRSRYLKRPSLFLPFSFITRLFTPKTT
jgi:DNA polymerase-3 subunit epsilon